MRKWAKLTRKDGVAVEVNMDQVAYVHHDGPNTILHLAYAQANKNCLLIAKETIDTIHQRTAMG
jgi:hypothetical protein